MFLEELDPKKNFGEYLAYGTTDKLSFGNYGNIFENMNHPNAKPRTFRLVKDLFSRMNESEYEVMQLKQSTV